MNEIKRWGFLAFKVQEKQRLGTRNCTPAGNASLLSESGFAGLKDEPDELKIKKILKS